MTEHRPDYGLADFEPAAPCHQDRLELVDGSEYTVLGEYRTWTDAYFVLYDQGATYGIPGSPQLRPVHVSRDLRERTFRVDTTELPLLAMAESWLIARGCPPGAITLAGLPPADDTTRALEARLRRNGDHFALLASYTDDEKDSPEVVAMLRSIDPKVRPEFRILLERFDPQSGTHTLREGAFATYERAVQWWGAWMDGDDPPLPPPAPAVRGAVTTSVPIVPAPTVIWSPGR